ncbi:MAG: UDP-N-acetylmuramoyl-L-alanyl-D-glutamate--2,6-diaminopimelate ligase [Candidatus Portnoybacteria bacterium]|nr:UDP-N-acetylmuramoyl-L-alanyl-D-glutamate--2,6-diaminopimelate ligase [Candidatus Portnoybacteria bacterium]MDD4982681.1 UDP-N-acetylmuramoyl-L-alanyl-D-glutamate--2,6-diaminopimelate ligase [Candidatus Portnoybacteria bacterium]
MKQLLKKLIPDRMLSIYHFKLALLGALVFGFPSRKLRVIGVTGTKGKSTVVMLAGKILQENITSPQPSPSKGEGEVFNPPTPLCVRGDENGDFCESGQAEFAPLVKGGAGGLKNVGWISSLTINDGKNETMNPYHMTMPGRFFIQKTLAQMIKNGCEYALVEVTSEGIKQHRHRFINWAGAAFTNLAAEHLEAHGGFENYRKAKEKLFAAAAKNEDSFGVYNLDDENVGEFLKYGIARKIGYGILNPPTPLCVRGDENGDFCESGQAEFIVKGGEEGLKNLRISNIQLSGSGSEFVINGVEFKTKFLGEFNIYNCAAAAAIGQVCGVPLKVAAQALAKIKSIPGRLEIIDEGQDFTVVVDLAHTPDSFEQVFRLFGELKQNKIISVFGAAGGGRDKWKRPELGRIASAYSDQVFITNEDPYEEDPLKIADEILAGCDKSKTDIILDRRQAIARALSLARKGDIVLILGKGTEQTMVASDKKYDWDDRRVVREELKKIVH